MRKLSAMHITNKGLVLVKNNSYKSERANNPRTPEDICVSVCVYCPYVIFSLTSNQGNTNQSWSKM